MAAKTKLYGLQEKLTVDRAKRHYIAGQVWKSTHRSHQRNFYSGSPRTGGDGSKVTDAYELRENRNSYIANIGPQKDEIDLENTSFPISIDPFEASS